MVLVTACSAFIWLFCEHALWCSL